MIKEKYYTVKEVAEILDVSDRTVYAWIRKGKIKVWIYRINRKLIARSDLNKFLKKYNF